MNKRRILTMQHLKPWLEEVHSNPPEIEGFQITRLEYIIHLVLSHKQDKHRASWSVLNMKIMQEQVPRAGKYLDFLYKENIIDRKNHSQGRNSRLYRMHNEGKTEYRILTDQYLVRRIEQSMQKLRRTNSKKYPFLNRAVRKIIINHEAAIQYIEQEYLQLGNDDRRTFLLAEVEKIRCGDIYMKVNDTNYRYDTNFSHIPGELHEFLTINGQPLVELDLVNSQPFFSACIFNPTPEVMEVMVKYIGETITMLPEKGKYHDREDVKRYTSLVTKGGFYEYMADKFDKAGVKYKNRKDLKIQMFTVFFGKLHAVKYDKATQIFQKYFPTVFRYFWTIKKFRGYNALAILLQRIESKIMLDYVVAKVEEEYPNLYLLTKHDSIIPFRQQEYYTTGSNFEIGKLGQLMLNEIELRTNLRPAGRAKRFPTIEGQNRKTDSQRVTAKSLT